MRGDLVTLLYEQTDVEYLFGDSVRTLEQDDRGVTVTFDHASARRFDLVVGADGMHSHVRRLAFGPDAQLITFQDHYFAFADADASLGEDRWMTMFNTPGRMAGIYRSGNHAQAKAYFLFRSAPLEYDHGDVATHKRLVSERFGHDRSWHTRELLDSALADPAFYFDALGQVRTSSWSRGRIALVGDAAWCASPASGAGAEPAMVGAYLPAGEVARAGADHRSAFAHYRAAHRRLVEEKQRIGLNVRLMVPRTAGGRRVRDAVARLPLTNTLGTAQRLTRTTGPGLPDYAPVAVRHGGRRHPAVGTPASTTRVAERPRTGRATSHRAGEARGLVTPRTTAWVSARRGGRRWWGAGGWRGWRRHPGGRAAAWRPGWSQSDSSSSSASGPRVADRRSRPG